jgi:uncharacterized protein (DUF2126 family)
MEGAEWNIAAFGEEKWQLANALLKRMQAHFAVGEVTHFGQGKWYPGEPLPRWALNVYWRKDGLAIWRNKLLLADQSADIPVSMLQHFMVQLAQRLDLNPNYGMPAYEDPWLAVNEEVEYLKILMCTAMN